MKKQIKIAIGAAAVLLIVLIGFCAWFLSGSGSTEYYAQIDNTKVEQVDTKGGVISFKGNLPYSYTLTAYDEKGGEKEITFGTSRELKEGAFIRHTRNNRGGNPPNRLLYHTVILWLTSTR